ncbi:MAG: polyprenyl synthetase family protein [Ktedonobacteraceae bacterium]|nr:polyprenyl synthetase family protein [Ktedonobacteraceae bacterium]
MVTSSSIQSTLLRHQRLIDDALKSTLGKAADDSGAPALDDFYGQMQYHLGWVDANLQPIHNNPGKLLRPTLLLLAYEVAGGWELADTADPSLEDSSYLQRALPAAVAVELTHNFTLIHDDIEDGDVERRHRPTLWKLWGIPQAINTGDGMFALARYALWGIVDAGVDGTTAVRLAQVLDRTILTVAEGQYLDINFETSLDISVAMYIDMIGRKTAALMSGATELGACLGTRHFETIAHLTSFGKALGIAFQIRDDILGVWATAAESGKTQAGDVYRRKKSLPILHALEHANPEDAEILRAIYAPSASAYPVTGAQVDQVLTIFSRTDTQAYCRNFLRHQCELARAALADVPQIAHPVAVRALDDMFTLIKFIEEE